MSLRTKLTFSERKQAETVMLEYLQSIPYAKNNPFLRSTFIDIQLKALEKCILRLKSFFQFITKLDFSEYIRWMQNACALYVPTQGVVTNNSLDIASSEDEIESFPMPSSEVPNKLSKNTKKLR